MNRSMNRNPRAGLLFCASLMGLAGGLATRAVLADTVYACVNEASGVARIVEAGTQCNPSSKLVQWQSSGAATPTIHYITDVMYPGTSVSRAFCPPGTFVTGGGGISLSGVGLQQSHPISDAGGAIAYGSTAVAWQVAAEDWSDVQAFVICMGF